MKHHRLIQLSLFAALVAVTAGFRSADSYSLVRTAKVGDELQYKFTATLSFGEIDITIEGKNAEKVTAVEEGRITVDTTQSDVSVTTPDGKRPGDSSEVSTMVFNPNRTLKSYKSGEDADPTSVRLSLVTTIAAPDKPVNVGEEWSTELSELGENTYKVKATYKVLGTEKIGDWNCVKISIQAKELDAVQPADCTGTVWLSANDFSTVKEDLTIENAPFAMTPPVKAHIVNERTK